MLSASDLVHLPYTRDLTEGGIAYALRSLPHAYQRMGGSSEEGLRRVVAEAAVELDDVTEIEARLAAHIARGVDVIKLLMKQGHMAQINDVIDADTAQLLAEELGHSVKRVAESDVEEGRGTTPTRGAKVSQGAAFMPLPCLPN